MKQYDGDRVRSLSICDHSARAWKGWSRPCTQNTSEVITHFDYFWSGIYNTKPSNFFMAYGRCWWWCSFNVRNALLTKRYSNRFFLRLMRIKTHRQPIYTHDPWYLMKTTHAFTTPLSRASRTHMSTEHAHGQHETRCGNSCSRLADEEDPKATCRCARAFPVFLPISC